MGLNDQCTEIKVYENGFYCLCSTHEYKDRKCVFDAVTQWPETNYNSICIEEKRDICCIHCEKVSTCVNCCSRIFNELTHLNRYGEE